MSIQKQVVSIGWFEITAAQHYYTTFNIVAAGKPSILGKLHDWVSERRIIGGSYEYDFAIGDFGVCLKSRGWCSERLDSCG